MHIAYMLPFFHTDWDQGLDGASDGSEDDSDSGEELDVADVREGRNGEHKLTPEARVFQAVAGMLFNAQADEVRDVLERASCCSTLEAH